MCEIISVEKFFLEDGYNIIMNDIGLFIDGIIVMLVDYFLLVESDFFILCDSSFGFIVVGLSMCEIDSYILVDWGCFDFIW